MDFAHMWRCLSGLFPCDEFSQNTIVAAVYGFFLGVTGIVYNKLDVDSGPQV
jgi:hypothetical protein